MSKLTDECLNDILQEVYGFRLEQWELEDGGGLPMTFARAIEAAATEPLLQRIADLEQRNSDLHEDVQRFKKHAMNEKAARLELERQLEEARKDAERYRWLRDVASGDVWGRIGNVYAPDETDEAIDAAMQKGQS